MSENKDIRFKFEGSGLNKDEKKNAKKQFASYRKNYNIDNPSDLELLSELIFRQMIQKRYKQKVEELSNKQKEIIPKYIFETLDKNLAEIITIKDKLGLFEDKKKTDPFAIFKALMKKFDIYKRNHQTEFQVVCPFCSKLFFLNIRTDKYKVSKLDLFKNKILTNKRLWELYKEGKITETDVAGVLNVSVDYVKWLEEKIYSKDSK